MKQLVAMIQVGLLIGLATLTPSAYAQDAVETGGFGAWIIDSLFEAGSITEQPDQAGIIGTTLIPLSLIAMLVAVVVIVFKSIQHLLVVAQAKDVDQSPVSMTWAPLHMVIAVTLIMPLPSGYSMGQYAAIWIAQQSNTLGNITAERALDYFETRGAITPPVLPSAQVAAKGIVASEICKALNNGGGEFVEDQGGTKISVAAREMTDSEKQSMSGLPAVDGSITRTGVTYAREKDGGFSGGAREINDYCGSLGIQYTASANTGGLLGGETDVNINESETNNESEVNEGCGWSILCMAGEKASAEEHRKKTIEFFQTAHEKASGKFISTATDGSASGIADKLLWDMEMYYDGKLDNENAESYITMQQQERAQIDAAVADTVNLIDGMQNDIYQSYASALSSTRSNVSDSGNNFMDTAKTVGWPIFGLYWFQYTNFSQKVMDSVEIQAAYSGDVDAFLEAFALSLNDPLLEKRLKDRVNAYSAALSKQLQNTRFDSSPGNGTAPDADYSMQASQDALKIREAFPAMKDELIANAKLGAISPENVYESVKQSVNAITRGDIFPYFVRHLREDNLVNALVNTGHNIITVSESIYFTKLMFSSLYKGWEKTFGSGDKTGDNASVEQKSKEESSWLGKVFDFFVGGAINLVMLPVWAALHAAVTVFKDFAGLWFYMFLVGLFLAFYIPAMIMIQWLIGLVTWMIYVVEATVVIPLWGLLFTADMGQKAFAPQTAQQGFVHLLSILVYPSLMVIGFVIGLKIIDLSSTFLVDFLVVGLLNSTDGYMFGILSMASGLVILGLAVYQIISRVFSLTLELNDHAMSWIGNRQGFGEGQVEQQTRGGVVAAIGKVEMGGRTGASKKEQEEQQKRQQQVSQQKM